MHVVSRWLRANNIQIEKKQFCLEEGIRRVKNVSSKYKYLWCLNVRQIFLSACTKIRVANPDPELQPDANEW